VGCTDEQLGVARAITNNSIKAGPIDFITCL
jgi:hypothetical protein